MKRRRVLILGAAGRDFHDFGAVFRRDADVEVVGFTAAQIPGIGSRRYPPELAGPLYPDGITIFPEAELERLVHRLEVDEVVLSYSDLSHAAVMHLASRALAAGAGFRLLSPKQTMLRSSRTVIAVAAVRTGCGKSQVTRWLARALRARGLRTVVVRHPMPYGDLRRQRVQRFETLSDLERANVTIEEREDYEPHIEGGSVVFAGVEYAEVLELAQREADIILWDGGNNDLPFLRPDLWITVTDPHRAGHELAYHPGETNLRAADVVVVNKVDSAPADSVTALRESIVRVRPTVEIVTTASLVTVDDPALIRGKRVAVVDDGPTLTHGEMRFGAAGVAAQRLGAEVIDPRPFAVGSIAATFDRYPHIGPAVPAVGYSAEQIRDLEATLMRIDCDAILVGTPIDLGRVIRLNRPHTRARYELEDAGEPTLAQILERFLDGRSWV